MKPIIYDGCMIENEKNFLTHFEQFENEPLSAATIETLLYCFNKSVSITFKANANYNMTNKEYRVILEKVMFNALNKYFELIDESEFIHKPQEKS